MEFPTDPIEREKAYKKWRAERAAHYSLENAKWEKKKPKPASGIGIVLEYIIITFGTLFAVSLEFPTDKPAKHAVLSLLIVLVYHLITKYGLPWYDRLDGNDHEG